MNKIIKNGSILTFFFIFIFFGCKNFLSNKEKQQCRENYEKFNFNKLELNGVKVSKFNINNFLKTYPKYDSIFEGYYYYGKSYFLYDEDIKDIVTIGIFDDNLYLNKRFNVDYDDLKYKFPCSFINSSDTEYNYKKCKVFTLYDERFSKIDFYYKENNILGLIYTIDEGKYLEEID